MSLMNLMEFNKEVGMWIRQFIIGWIGTATILLLCGHDPTEWQYWVIILALIGTVANYIIE